MFANYEDYELRHPGGDPSQIAYELERASNYLRVELRQHISRATSTVTLRGSSSRELQLPEWPVIDVESVHINGRLVDLSGAVVTTRGIVWPRSGTPGPGDAGRTGPSWGGGEALVEVTYTHGWDPVPLELRDLAVDIAAAKLARPVGVRSQSEAIGSYQNQKSFDVAGDEIASQIAAVRKVYGK